ncbi:MAG: SiaB family protein kinase [Flammeovirgaceae bacterium]|nr:SiaB family protein kinase [Flammeovirgaceae bacterium]MDW8288076.1 SiaB family protein kinase [Flammeovirgaceae bacterium]
MKNKDILASYYGAMSSMIISEVCKEISSFWGQEHAVGKKIYNIFVELAQNIAYYSSERTQLPSESIGNGFFVIEQTAKFVVVVTGNLIENKSISFLEEKIQQINALDRVSLRKLKFAQRENPNPPPNSRGAGVGLIQVGLVSESLLEANFIPIDCLYSLFQLTVRVKKQ